MALSDSKLCYDVISVDNVANKQKTHPGQGVRKNGTLVSDGVCFELEKKKTKKRKKSQSQHGKKWYSSGAVNIGE